MFRLESLFRRGVIESKYRPFKYHLLGVFRAYIGGPHMPDMKANKFERYCEAIKVTLWDDAKCEEGFDAACTVLDEILGGNFERDAAKDSALQVAAQLLAEHDFENETAD